VSFLLQEENLTPYVEGSLGRWFPVTKAGQAAPVLEERCAPPVGLQPVHVRNDHFEFTKNYKFTVLNNENVWAKAANRVLNEKVPVDKAVDEMIARIKTVAG
jgi:multiple sugar transport system substrate-binding protein